MLRRGDTVRVWIPVGGLSDADSWLAEFGGRDWPLHPRTAKLRTGFLTRAPMSKVRPL